MNIIENENITGDIISMVHKIGLTLAAEGVEVGGQWDYLIENDCDDYLVSRPLSKEDALELLKTNNTI